MDWLNVVSLIGWLVVAGVVVLLVSRLEQERDKAAIQASLYRLSLIRLERSHEQLRDDYLLLAETCQELRERVKEAA